MSNRLLRLCLLGLALVLSNLYWWRREQRTRESLSVSQHYQRSGTESQSPRSSSDRAAAEAADRLQTDVQTLPEAVERLDSKVRDLHGEADRVRTELAAAWWNAAQPHPTTELGPTVVTAVLDGGTLTEAKALVKQSLQHADVICLVAAKRDQTFAVGVGGQWTDQLTAAELADRIANRGDGGGGGDIQFATGGGIDKPAEWVQAIADDIRDQFSETDDTGSAVEPRSESVSTEES